MPQSSSQTTPQNTTPRAPLNAYQEFLWRQSARMYAGGATPAMIADYIDRAEQNNLRAIIMAPNEPPPEYPGVIRGTVQQVLRGATFGFADEALGTLAGIITPGMTAQQGRDLMRAEQAAFEATRPKTSFGATLLGGAASMAVPGAAVLGAGGKVGAAAVGAGGGALVGAGEAQGGLSERSRGALLGGGVGAVAGPVVGGAVKAAAGVAGATARGARQALPDVFRQRVSSLIAALPGSPERAAMTLVAEALDLDGVAPSLASARVRQRAVLGTPTTLVDVGGDHVMALAQEAQGFRTPEQQAFAQRIVTGAMGAGERLLDALGAKTRVGLQNVHELRRRVIQRRADRATPLYELAHNEMVQVGIKTKNLLKQSLWRDAYEAGRQVSLQEEAAGISKGLAIPALGDDLPDNLPVKALDYMKQGLDVIIEKAGSEGRPPMSTRTARALRQQLSGVLEEVDAKVPIYKQARSVWQGYSQALDELKEGMENFLTSSPAEIKAHLARSTDPEMYRIGSLQAVADAVHGARASAKDAERFFGSNLFGAQDRTQLQRLQALIPDRASAQEFADRVASEATLAYPASRLGGPATPNPEAATRRLIRSGRVRNFMQQHGVAVPREDRARQVANEVTRLFALGLDDPRALAETLRAVPHFRQTAQRAVAIPRVVGAATTTREVESRGAQRETTP